MVEDDSKDDPNYEAVRSYETGINQYIKIKLGGIADLIQNILLDLKMLLSY